MPFGIYHAGVITACLMLTEMRQGGLKDQALADLTGLDQGHISRIRTGKRKNVWPQTYASINEAYLKWKADQAALQIERAA